MPEVEVSIVMSVYNAERYLREAIDSILTQTFSNFEFIIVNDGSTDNSLQIIESYKDERIVLLNQENTGLAKALNKGIDFSKGRFIARMDADDISLPTRLQKQYDFLKRNPEYIAVGSSAIIIDVNGNYIFTSFIATTDDEAKKNLPKTPFYHSAVMFQKKEFLKAGKYCEAMLKSQDTVLFNRMAKYGKFYNIKEPLLRYRIVPTANSTRSNYGRDRFLTILEKAIKKNEISNEDKLFIDKAFEKRNSTYRLSNYYLFLAKKYLWNNYNPKIARENIFLSIKINLTLSALLLYLFSFFPERIICEIYKRSKK
jgi:glycosyltransferase involved in cell wall biosynthesis